MNHPSRTNELAFNRAVDDVAAAARHLIDSIETKSPPRTREEELRKARSRNAKRFGKTA